MTVKLLVDMNHAQDKPAAQVLGGFTRTYIDQHQEFFATDPPTISEPTAKGG